MATDARTIEVLESESERERWEEGGEQDMHKADVSHGLAEPPREQRWCVLLTVVARWVPA